MFRDKFMNIHFHLKNFYLLNPIKDKMLKASNFLNQKIVIVVAACLAYLALAYLACRLANYCLSKNMQAQRINSPNAEERVEQIRHHNQSPVNAIPEPVAYDPEQPVVLDQKPIPIRPQPNLAVDELQEEDLKLVQ